MLLNQIRDTKIKVLASLKQGIEEERSEWRKLSVSLKVTYSGHSLVWWLRLQQP